MNIVKPLWHSILAIGIGLSPVGGLEQAIAQDQTEQTKEQAKGQTLESEDNRQAGEQIKHDHSEMFYTKTYSSKNIPELEEELKKHPTSQGYVRLSDVFALKKQFKKAKAAAENAVLLNPKNWEGYQNLGAIQTELGNYTEARKQLEQSKKLAPAKASIYYCFGVIECDLKRYHSALAYYEKALKIDPHYSTALEAKRELQKFLQILK